MLCRENIPRNCLSSTGFFRFFLFPCSLSFRLYFIHCPADERRDRMWVEMAGSLSHSVALLEAPCHSFVIQQLKFPADVCVVCA